MGEELKEMAKIKAQVLMKTQMNVSDDDQDPCGLELESIENFQTQVVAERFSNLMQNSSGIKIVQMTWQDKSLIVRDSMYFKLCLFTVTSLQIVWKLFEKKKSSAHDHDDI